MHCLIKKNEHLLYMKCDPLYIFFLQLFQHLIQKIRDSQDFEERKKIFFTKFQKKYRSEITGTTLEYETIIESDRLLAFLCHHHMSIEEFFAYTCEEKQVPPRYFNFAILTFTKVVYNYNISCCRKNQYQFYDDIYIFRPLCSLQSDILPSVWDKIYRSTIQDHYISI